MWVLNLVYDINVEYKTDNATEQVAEDNIWTEEGFSVHLDFSLFSHKFFLKNLYIIFSAFLLLYLP
jgi:hypothetical protein